MLRNEKPGEIHAEIYQGGIFTVAEDIPNPAAPPRKEKATTKARGKKK